MFIVFDIWTTDRLNFGNGCSREVPKIRLREKLSYLSIPDRKEWVNGLPVPANMVWYTDGSQTEQGSEAGIYEGIRGTIRLG